MEEKKKLKKLYIAYEDHPCSDLSNGVTIADTNVLMSLDRPGVVSCLNYLCTVSHITVTEENVKELERLSISPDAEKRRRAEAGLMFLSKCGNRVAVHQQTFENSFADRAIISLCDNLSASGYDVNVLTFDLDLTRDLLSRDRLYCSNCFKPAGVYKPADGHLCRARIDNSFRQVISGFFRNIVRRFAA